MNAYVSLVSNLKDEELYEELVRRLGARVKEMSGLLPLFGSVRLLLHKGSVMRVDYEPSMRIHNVKKEL